MFQVFVQRGQNLVRKVQKRALGVVRQTPDLPETESRRVRTVWNPLGSCGSGGGHVSARLIAAEWNALRIS